MTNAAALPRPTAELTVVAVGTAALGAVAAILAHNGAWRGVALLLVAATLGATFLKTGFSYTGTFRNWMTRRDGSGLAAGIAVAMVAAIVIIPVAALVPGYNGYAAPLGLPLIGGAMLFGAGMQWANGCGSGTLFTAGGGSRRMWVTLPCFCAGGLLGSLMLPTAFALPALPEVVLPQILGPWLGLAATLVLAAALIGLVLGRGPRPDAQRLKAAGLIGALAAVAFLLSGQPWGITSGLTLWGAKAAAALGLDIAHTTFWSCDGPKQILAGSVLAQDSSLMDIGMLLGAVIAAGQAGSFHRQPMPPLRGFAGAAIGGILMGVGARLSFGCNVGAMVGGIASGSMHGFVWFFAVIPGCWLGIRLRPWFGLSR